MRYRLAQPHLLSGLYLFISFSPYFLLVPLLSFRHKHLSRPPKPLARWQSQLRKQSFWQGFFAVGGGGVALAIWGLVTGIAMIHAGMSLTMVFGMALTVYAGSAQLAAIPLMAEHAPWWLVILTGLVVNSRFIMYSAALHPLFAHLSWKRRTLMSYLVADIALVVVLPRWQRHMQRSHLLSPQRRLVNEWFYWGISAACWFIWQISLALGVFLAHLIPTNWSLDYAATLVLIGLGANVLQKKTGIFAALTACVVALSFSGLPLRLGLLLGLLSGVCVAWVLGRKSS